MGQSVRKEERHGKKEWGGYLVFLLLAYIISALLLLVMAFLLFRFQLSSKTVEGGVIAIYMISSFAAGFMAGKKAGTKKYLWGMVMGGAYFLVLAVLSILFGSGGGGASDFLGAAILCLGAGMLGGMLS